MDFLTLSKERYTAKHYDVNRKISNEDLDKLLEIVRLSPSAVNAQAWKFFVGSQKSMAKIMPAICDFNRDRVGDCSHFIVMCAQNKLDEASYKEVTKKEDADGRYPNHPNIRDIVDEHRIAFGKLHESLGDYAQWTSKQVYIAMTALIYGAKSMGIDSTAMEGIDYAKLDEILNLKAQNLHSVVVVALGYSSDDDSNKKRPKSRRAKECSILIFRLEKTYVYI